MNVRLSGLPNGIVTMRRLARKDAVARNDTFVRQHLPVEVEPNFVFDVVVAPFCNRMLAFWEPNKIFVRESELKTAILEDVCPSISASAILLQQTLTITCIVYIEVISCMCVGAIDTLINEVWLIYPQVTLPSDGSSVHLWVCLALESGYL